MHSDTMWANVNDLVTWLDTNRRLPPEVEQLMRIMKITEESGEVAAALVGVLGQNPRKGVTHSWDDVKSELCDVILTALVALQSLDPDAQKVFAAHLEGVIARSQAATRADQPS